MLASLKIILDTDELDYRAASEMQGVLFDRIESDDYADKLHAQGMHPYSQYIIRKGNVIETKSKKELMSEFYSKEHIGSISTEFISATAFKRAGNYCILPEIRLIFQNLMQKYTAASDEVDMMDEDTLEDIVAHTFVSRHKIRSATFPFEGTKISGFIGNVSIGVKGSDTLRRYVRLLLEF